MKQEMMRWQQHRLDHLQIMCTLLQREPLQHPVTQFLYDRCSSCRTSNQQYRSIHCRKTQQEGIYIYEKIVAFHHCLD